MVNPSAKPFCRYINLTETYFQLLSFSLQKYLDNLKNGDLSIVLSQH